MLKLFTASYDDYSFQNLTKKMPAGVFAPTPLNRVKVELMYLDCGWGLHTGL